MAEYTNLICPVCEQKFSPDDDIVVCPVCGTPHHRECYAKQRQCANHSWHSENKSYDADEERKKLSQENEQNEENRQEKRDAVTCSRCGQQNDAQAIFCNRCGAPVSQGFASGEDNPFSQRGFGAAPFNPFASLESDEKIDGVETWKYTAVVKENAFRFVPQFKMMFKRNRKTSFNFAAFMFSPFYFFYRKMYGIGAVLGVLFLILNIPTFVLNFTNEALSEIVGATVSTGISLTAAQIKFWGYAYYFSSIGITALRFLSGIFANWFYFKKCKKTAAEISQTTQSREEFAQSAHKRGGVNRVVVIALILACFFVIWSALFVIMDPSFIGL